MGRSLVLYEFLRGQTWTKEEIEGLTWEQVYPRSRHELAEGADPFASSVDVVVPEDSEVEDMRARWNFEG